MNKKMITGVGGGLLALVVVVAVSAAGAKKKEAARHETEKLMAQKSSPRPVRLETVKAAPIGTQRSFPGVVNASDEVELSFRVGGPLSEVNVVLGEPVKKGDLLMQIDPRDFEDRIRSLEAQLSGAVAVRDHAKQDYTRIARLFKDQVVPQSDYDRAKSALDSSESTVKNVEAQLLIARHALEDTSLRAPYDGTVSDRMVENYEMVKPGQVVMHYQDIQRLEIVVKIPENEMSNAPVQADGTTVKVSFPALPESVFEARVKEWSTRSDPLTRTYSVTFEMEAPNTIHILPGMTASVELFHADRAGLVLTVPVSALVADAAGGSSVWVYEKARGRAELRRVVPGRLIGSSRVVIAEGLADGERVVVTGSRLIHGDLPLKTVSAQ